MKASEILRKLADIVDGAEQPAPQVQPIVVNVGQSPTAEPSIAEPAEVPDDIMIPPLQQKLELMKHQAGIDSVYDEVCDDCGQTPCSCDMNNDEVAILKRNAGLPVIQQADEDEPFDG